MIDVEYIKGELQGYRDRLIDEAAQSSPGLARQQHMKEAARYLNDALCQLDLVTNPGGAVGPAKGRVRFGDMWGEE